MNRWKYGICMILTAILILFPTTALALDKDSYPYPIYDDGMLTWKYLDSTFALPLGSPGTGGWFNFPYLYTIFNGRILIWDLTEGFPQLVGSFEEPEAKNLVMIGDKLLIEVTDGFDIFIMETPTNPITYGGTLAPCEKGKLIYHNGNVFIACPDKTYVWDSEKLEFTATTGKPTPQPIPMPIPPMVWGKILATSGNYALVSDKIPLFLLSSGTLSYAGPITANTSKGKLQVLSSQPPYKVIFETAEESATARWGAVVTENGHLIVSASGTIYSDTPVHEAVAIGEHGIARTASGEILGLSFNPPSTWKLPVSIPKGWHLTVLDNRVAACSPQNPHISMRLGLKNISIFFYYTSSCVELSGGNRWQIATTHSPLTWVENGVVLTCEPTPAGFRFADFSNISPSIITRLMCFSYKAKPVVKIPTSAILVAVIISIFAIKTLKRKRPPKGKIRHANTRKRRRKVWRYGSGGL